MLFRLDRCGNIFYCAVLSGETPWLIVRSRQPICVWEFDGPLVEWNRGSEEAYGYARDAVLGKRREQLLSTSVPGSSFDELKAKLLRDGSWTGVLCQTSKEGHMLTVESLLELEAINGRRLVLETSCITGSKGELERR
jgi:two-component system CheB/CheR fusion protein